MTDEEKKLEILARARAFVRDDEQDEQEALEASRANFERRNKRSENYSAVDPEKPATADFRPHFDPVRRQWPRPEPPKPERKLDTMPIDWQERIDAAIESERATTYEVVAHVIAEMTAEHERQIAELKSEVESLKADHTAMGLQQFGRQARPHIGPVHRSLSIASIAVRSICRRCRWPGG